MTTETREPEAEALPVEKRALSAAGPAAPLTGEVQETVDPFDYAETIVRDLALHVGTRLRDFRADLATMHSAVVQLPETMKINALGQSIQELRERLAHLTGVVSQQVTRYPEELDRVAKGVGELTNRVAGLESWIAVARQSVAQGDTPNLPLPSGGFVGHDQFDKVIDQVHDSILRVVSAVRGMQLDIRDLRGALKEQGGNADPAPALPAPDPGLAALSRRVEALEQAARPVPAPAAGEAAALAGLVFGAWSRLSQPSGAEALAVAVDEVLAVLATRLDHVVRPPQLAKGSGLVAVATGEGRSGPVAVLVATEDLCGRTWFLGRGGAEMRSDEPDGQAARTPCWRALLSAAALAAQARPGTTVVPVLVYGNGTLDLLPSLREVTDFAQSVGAGAAAGRLVSVAVPGLELVGAVAAGEVGTALAGL